MTSETLVRLRSDTLTLLRPPPMISTADWIEQTIYLPDSASALPGRMRLWAYQRGICDALDDPEIERVSVLKSARIGYTALIQGVIANYVANAPTLIMSLQPTSDDARRFAVDLEEVFDASPALRGMLTSEDSADRSTMYDRRFPGGSLKFVGARAARNLRGHTVRILAMDEIDGYEMTDEGDPIALAETRTKTFGRNRKIIAGSTPVFDSGPITRAYRQSDQRIYEVPCPSCGEFSEIKWGDIEWDEGDPASAHWVCPLSGCVVDERAKAAMVAAGRWRATAPEVKGHAGFRINALNSPHYAHRWSVLVAEFLEAKKSPETLQAFVNTVLAEPWQIEGDALDEDELCGRREPFSLAALPADVLFITVGVDVQNDRLEAVVMGHGRTDIYLLAHEIFIGPVDGESVWADLDAMLRSTWSHPNGGTIRVDAAVIDSGSGGHVEIVHGFTRSRFARRIVSIKGLPGFTRPFIEKSKSGGHPLWLVGVDAVKSALFARLERGQGVRFSEALGPVFFEQLTSERRVVRMSRGRSEVRFERIKGKRAETLDGAVYAWAARHLVNVNLDHRAEELSSRVERPKSPPNQSQPKWIDRWR
ncbi:phage terminase large subunit family protein [Brevundimonas sp. EYE_349]|uniref:phage terminase large subunit family protein n=1 Tax=Brevundimonas sp. EYE_349 TaxID=2853455 RepID=UPI002005384C|nr:phage terminase large subunit family protein [Brevundimonas sp. EYE_349]MCK6102898.1 phage terminase large subunit family protein [Brevundimonas sp. EYE_349]